MEIKELYNSIKENNVTDKPLIFYYTDNDFLVNQYIDEIAKQHNLRKRNIESLEEINQSKSSLYSLIQPELFIYRTEKIEWFNLLSYNNLIVVCKDYSDGVQDKLKEYLVKFPILLDWQIKDYILSNLPNMSELYINELYNSIPDIYKIQTEVDKLSLFKDVDQAYLLFKENGDYKKKANYQDLADAITSRNLDKIKNIYQDLDGSNIYELIAILYNNFKYIINIQLNPNASPESLNISEKAFWFMKYNKLNKYSDKKLYDIFLFITDLDRKIKLGEVNVTLDYILVKILGGVNY